MSRTYNETERSASLPASPSAPRITAAIPNESLPPEGHRVHPLGRLPELVRERRQELGISIRKLRRISGLSRSSIERLESGVLRTLWPAPRLQALANALELTQADLLEAAGYDLGGAS